MKRPSTFFTLILVHLLTFNSSAQLEFSKWYFGMQAGLDFATIPPTILTNGVINTGGGVASISDAAGNLLFYTDGIAVVNSNHSAMANGLGLLGGSSSAQGAMIVKQPGNANIYYLFIAWGSANYSIVDMTLAAGLGSVTVKNINTYTNTTTKQVAIRHCNGKDAWILSHEMGSNNFMAYLLTSTGLSPNPVISAVGPPITGTGASFGMLKISPDGKKLAMSNRDNPPPNSEGNSGFYLFDFDPSSGVVSNSLLINSSLAFGIEFSPDGRKLYGVTSTTLINTPQTLYQWDICSGSLPTIIASAYTIGLGSYNLGGPGPLQRAINNKIYLSISSNTAGLTVINNPNLSGASMGYVANGQSVAPKQTRQGLPNFINFYIKPAPQPFTNTVACNQVNFSPPPVPTFSSGCSSTPYSPSGYLWDFGEPSSGTANTSNLSSPSHVYASVGTYTVKLVLLNACTNDTLIQSVNITTLGPTPAVTGPTLICKGDRYTYTVSGGSSYLWSTGSTATAVALQPTQSTVYTVSATANGCTQSKTFTVTVNPCLGIEDLQAAGIWKVFPNPVVNELKIESAFEGKVKLFDLNGRMVFEATLVSGENTINTSSINAGVYNLQLSNSNFKRNLRMVKVE
jgi:PKD repeat protein